MGGKPIGGGGALARQAPMVATALYTSYLDHKLQSYKERLYYLHFLYSINNL